MTVKITVLLFAAARVRAGSASLEVELTEPATVLDLKAALARSCPDLMPLLGSARVAVDASYATDLDWVSSGSEVAIIPPVSGGV